jgi:hypothetical protein
MYHKANLNRIMADYCGQPIDKVRMLWSFFGSLCGGILRAQPHVGPRSPAEIHVQDVLASCLLPGPACLLRSTSPRVANRQWEYAGPCMWLAYPICCSRQFCRCRGCLWWAAATRVCLCLQIEEDTDRDRYMSPLEARSYGIIDHIVGGDEVRSRAEQGGLRL